MKRRRKNSRLKKNQNGPEDGLPLHINASTSIPGQIPACPLVYKELEQDLEDYLDHILSFGREIDLKTKAQQRWLEENDTKYSFIDSGRAKKSKHDYKNDDDDESYQDPPLQHSNIKHFNYTNDYLSDIEPRIPLAKNSGAKKYYLVHAEDQLLYKDFISSYLQPYSYVSFGKKRFHSVPVYVFKWPRDSIMKRMLKDKQNKVKLSKTDHWEEEYGDGVTFQEMKKILDVTDNDNDDNPNNSTKYDGDKEGDTIHNEKEAFEEILHNAWDRAVHLASTTVVASASSCSNNVNSEDSTTNISIASSSNKSRANVSSARFSHSPSSFQSEDDVNISEIDHDDSDTDSIEKLKQMSNRISSNQIQSIMKCKSLGISFDPIKVFDKDGTQFYKCQCCHQDLEFISNEDVYQHLFGSNGNIGCCWKKIKLKHYDIMKSLLEREGIHIIDGLLHIILKHGMKRMRTKHKSYQENQSKNDDHNQRRKRQNHGMNWVDILTFMRKELDESIDECDDDKATSTCTNNSNRDGEMFRTLKVKKDVLPITLNDDVLNKVISRVIDRYGIGNNFNT